MSVHGKGQGSQSPVRPTTLSQTSAMGARMQEAFINVFQHKPGKQPHHRCWVLQSPRSQLGLCSGCPTPAAEHCSQAAPFWRGNVSPKLEFFIYLFISIPPAMSVRPPQQARKLVLEKKKTMIFRERRNTARSSWNEQQRPTNQVAIHRASWALQLASSRHRREVMFIFAPKGERGEAGCWGGGDYLSPSLGTLHEEGVQHLSDECPKSTNSSKIQDLNSAFCNSIYVLHTYRYDIRYVIHDVVNILYLLCIR